MRWTVLLLFLFIVRANATTKIDTIVIHVDTVCNDFMPHRAHFSIPCSTCDPVTYFEQDDSIRVCGQVINGFRKQYHLIVYDNAGVKRLEGNFWDHLADGFCVDYDARGRKISEGSYKLVKKKHYYYPSAKTGKWIYYDINGNVIRKEEFKLTSRYIRHEKAGLSAEAIPAYRSGP